MRKFNWPCVAEVVVGDFGREAEAGVRAEEAQACERGGLWRAGCGRGRGACGGAARGRAASGGFRGEAGGCDCAAEDCGGEEGSGGAVSWCACPGCGGGARGAAEGPAALDADGQPREVHLRLVHRGDGDRAVGGRAHRRQRE